MRLTHTMRDAFVRAAMHDVPKVDYDEQVQKFVREYVAVMFARDFPGIDMNVVMEKKWLNKTSLCLPGNLKGPYLCAPDNWRMLEADKKAWDKLTELSEKKNAQERTLSDLESKLRSVAYSCNTRAQLLEALPEFEKYLPADDVKAIRTLPALANVVADFAKAGWPKDKKKAVAA